MKNRSFRRRLLAALVGVALAAGGAVATMTAPAAVAAGPVIPGPLDDSFYSPPSPLPAGQPGDVIRWRPSVPMMNAANADAWEVMYLSTNALGERNAVTGTIMVPKGVDPSTAPIVGFAVGTQGPAFKCTPSKAISRGTLYDQPAINDSLSSGYAVAVTDYEGYSPNTVPTYITGQSMGPAVIDSVRAAQRLAQAGLSEDSKVIFQGYSQGGGGALWAAEKQPSYAPEMNLVGVAAGGVPADLTEVAKGLDGYLGFGFLAFAAVGLDAAYPELDLDSYLNDTGRTELADAKANACVVELLANYPFKKISDYTTSNPLDTPQWQARLAENKLGSAPPRVPVFQYHAATDEIVNTPQADALHKQYCAAGVTEQWQTYVSDHLSGIFAGNGDAHQWIVDRFAGEEAPSNC
ncbi:pimeloyl-ACP methyl ester carboxylesterase [Amycolatopsis endophytica]|uniref:Pimeloyl-ACP methyl ester carboxylesterase n=1 Tax=Amycolatopsis endophytica TaxID=860233 RepID=A0A853B2Z9_9PSEU|nr:lipase family protein [Amycolatopsis endophytica]NYI89498.1 pimeloyl-ACP methyl ester carboxylesterase [Amycolatopsis endophytica]